MNRRRIIGLALVAGTVALALTTLKGADRAVSVRYEAPPGPLTVTVSTPDGTRVRRTTFAADAERQHDISLQDGHFRARLELPGRPGVDRSFQVEGDGALLIRWSP